MVVHNHITSIKMILSKNIVINNIWRQQWQTLIDHDKLDFHQQQMAANNGGQR